MDDVAALREDSSAVEHLGIAEIVMMGGAYFEVGNITPSAEFTTSYNTANRVLEIRFKTPLERFRTVKIDLLEGILGVDGQPLKPWTLTFSIWGP